MQRQCWQLRAFFQGRRPGRGYGAETPTKQSRRPKPRRAVNPQRENAPHARSLPPIKQTCHCASRSASPMPQKFFGVAGAACKHRCLPASCRSSATRALLAASCAPLAAGTFCTPVPPPPPPVLQSGQFIACTGAARPSLSSAAKNAAHVGQSHAGRSARSALRRTFSSYTAGPPAPAPAAGRLCCAASCAALCALVVATGAVCAGGPVPSSGAVGRPPGAQLSCSHPDFIPLRELDHCTCHKLSNTDHGALVLRHERARSQCARQLVQKQANNVAHLKRLRSLALLPAAL